MTEVIITQALGGKDFTYQKGEKVELDPKTARNWADKGLCSIVEKKRASSKRRKPKF